MPAATRATAAGGESVGGAAHRAMSLANGKLYSARPSGLPGWSPPPLALWRWAAGPLFRSPPCPEFCDGAG